VGVGESAVIGEDDQLSPAASAHLDHGTVDVRLDGGGAEHEPCGDLVVGQASCHQRGDLAFAFGQRQKDLAGLYWESIRRVNEWISGAVTDTVSVPVGCSVFPKELQRPSRRWAQRRFTDIRYWNEPERGGHFAALEQPALFVNEVRACFRALRSDQATSGTEENAYGADKPPPCA
jgi:hypothetical protein